MNINVGNRIYNMENVVRFVYLGVVISNTEFDEKNMEIMSRLSKENKCEVKKFCDRKLGNNQIINITYSLLGKYFCAEAIITVVTLLRSRCIEKQMKEK